jgi:hypothetical protein
MLKIEKRGIGVERQRIDKSVQALLTLIAVGCLLSGCPDDHDFGEDEIRHCLKSLAAVIALEIPGHTLPAPLKHDGVLCTRLYPGQIIKMKVTGGYDKDFRFDEKVAPLTGCADMVPVEDCSAEYDDPSPICVVTVSNRETPYKWELNENKGKVIMEVDEDSELHNTCYLEVDAGYIDKSYSFTVTVTRKGASVAEYGNKPNEASRIFEFSVESPPIQYLKVAENPETPDLGCSMPGEIISFNARKQRCEWRIAESSADNLDFSLKNAFYDTEDRHVPVHYIFADVQNDDAAPVRFEQNASVYYGTMALKNKGYDVCHVDWIVDADNPPPSEEKGENENNLWGIALPTLDFIFIPVERYVDYEMYLPLACFHEIGHCVLNEGNEAHVDSNMYPYNVMRSSFDVDDYQYMDINIEQSACFQDGPDAWSCEQ